MQEQLAGRRHVWRRGGMALGIVLIIGAVLVGAVLRAQAAPRPVPATVAQVSLDELQQMIFVWASGTPQVQALARQKCQSLSLSTAQCGQISAAVRSAWVDLLRSDPADVGNPTVRPHLTARNHILQLLAVNLSHIVQRRLPLLLAATGTTYHTIATPAWVSRTQTQRGTPVPLGHFTVVWATAYEQTMLPPGMTPTGSQYAALPDLYLSMANVGNGANIPSFYQPYYLPASGAHWAVSIATASTGREVTNVLITDVGPWNEDDNWWDANNTSTTLPTSCPVSTTLHAPDATSNALVDGICPNGHNYRRLYYYVLYQHNGLPFFQSANYLPSGSFADGTAWPTALAFRCAETAYAAINNDGSPCVGSAPTGYNGNHGAWLRDGTNDNPILNQSSIDLSPAVDAALGWTYPSSGLVSVNTATLP
jgi:hypothetical protein